jgi:hypothetical protein
MAEIASDVALKYQDGFLDCYGGAKKGVGYGKRNAILL